MPSYFHAARLTVLYSLHLGVQYFGLNILPIGSTTVNIYLMGEGMEECLDEPWNEEISSNGMKFLGFEPALYLSTCIHKLQMKSTNIKRIYVG